MESEAVFFCGENLIHFSFSSVHFIIFIVVVRAEFIISNPIE